MKKLICFLLIVLASCKSYQQRSDIRSNSDLFGQEIYQVAGKITDSLKTFIEQKGWKTSFGILPIKNDTTEEFPTDLIRSIFIKKLNENEFTITEFEHRQEMLKELALSQSGIGNRQLSSTNIVIISHFLKINLLEHVSIKNGIKVLERFVQVQLLEVESGLILWTMDKSLTIQKKKSNKVSW